MDKKVFSYILIAMFALSSAVFADNQPNELKYDGQLQSYVMHVPAGMTAGAILSQDINSKTAVVGQTINAILVDDLKYKNRIIACAGSIITGSIVYNRRAGIAGKSAQMQIRFTTIITPYNNIIPISAIIATADSTGILKGETHLEPPASLGGGLALAQAVATKGDGIFVPSNSRLDLIFDQPITLGAP